MLQHFGEYGDVLFARAKRTKKHFFFLLKEKEKGKRTASSNYGLRANALRRFDDGAMPDFTALTTGYVKVSVAVPQHAFNGTICNFFILVIPIASHIISGLLW